MNVGSSQLRKSEGEIMKSCGMRLIAGASVVAGLLMTIVPFGPAEAQWVFLARKAAGRIHHMVEGQQGNRPGYDFASVILEAPAAKVFAVALDHARKNTAVHIVMVDQAQHRFQVAQGDRTATIHVVPLSDEVSQLYVAGTAGPNETPTTSQVIAAVLRVCSEMQKSCSVGN
jgi:hypothetical protein